ncbi:acylphosphatase [Compostimonas suwonensis]|uniref:acylphosphatase n=1 Tax=Compostimonas suwonensis TaxID=1048394 RepID=A0A2M9BW02_9MICO|nr:acylphosphatase [Compostimonas suwonensis]PJJ62130.1 acylphosphatase [Compostimonas suwonensis]
MPADDGAPTPTPTPTPTPVRRAIAVRGLVQGVGFRYSIAREARHRALGGWARNTAEGGLEAQLEGPAIDVDSVVEWMRTGPPGAEVAELTARDIPPLGERDFEIRR